MLVSNLFAILVWGGINQKLYLWLMQFGSVVELIEPAKERAEYLEKEKKCLGHILSLTNIIRLSCQILSCRFGSFLLRTLPQRGHRAEMVGGGLRWQDHKHQAQGVAGRGRSCRLRCYENEIVVQNASADNRSRRDTHRRVQRL